MATIGALSASFSLPEVENFSRGISGSRSFRWREKSRIKLRLSAPGPKVLVSLQVLFCSGVRSNIAWQSFKCASHLAQRRSNYCLLCDVAFEVGTAYLK